MPDHTMSLPLCGKKESGFNGKIITTALTSELTHHILRDSTKIHIADVKRYNYLHGTHIEPLYSEEDCENALSIIRGYSYNQKIFLNDNVYVQLLSSGHQAGSALIYLTYKGEYKDYHLLYCADMYYGDCPRAFTKSIENKTYKADVVILESTYANKKPHPKENPRVFLEEMIMEHVVKNKKQIFIPVFSMQRSTQIIKLLDEILKTNEAIKNANIPIYNCGKLTKLCHETIGKKEYEEFYDKQWLEDKDIFYNPCFGYITEKQDLDRFVLNNNPKITLASAGSCNAGMANSIMESFIPNKTVKLMSCGYVFPESVLDRTIKNETRVTINGVSKTKRMEYIGGIKNLSGHVDLENSIKFIKLFDQKKLKKVLIMHGNEDARQCLKNRLEKELKEDKQVSIMRYGQSIYL